jgi:hypothetical protein
MVLPIKEMIHFFFLSTQIRFPSEAKLLALQYSVPLLVESGKDARMSGTQQHAAEGSLFMSCEGRVTFPVRKSLWGLCLLLHAQTLHIYMYPGGRVPVLRISRSLTSCWSTESLWLDPSFQVLRKRRMDVKAHRKDRIYYTFLKFNILISNGFQYAEYLRKAK